MIAEIDLPSRLLVICALVACVIIASSWGCSVLSRRRPSAALAWLSLLLAFGLPAVLAVSHWQEAQLIMKEDAAWGALAIYILLAIPVVSNSVVGITKHRRYSFEHPSTFEIVVREEPSEQREQLSSWDKVRP